MTRWLRWFDLAGDSVVGETMLATVSLLELQALFGAKTEDPMYESFSVDANHVQFLQQLVAHPIDLARFAYFVEADAVAG